MDPSSIIAQVDRDPTPPVSTRAGGSGSATEHKPKGNMKKQLVIIRDRLFCCMRREAPSPISDQSNGRSSSKSQNKRAQIYNPQPKNQSQNVSVLRRTNRNGADRSEPASNGRSDMPLLNDSGECVTCDSVVISESREDGVKMQQGRGVLYEVHLSTTLSSPGRQTSPSQATTTMNNGEISYSNDNNRTRSSSSYASGATNGQPTTSTPISFVAANNASNTARSPQVFSPSSVSGVNQSVISQQSSRRIVATYPPNDSGMVSQTAAGASSSSFSSLLGEPHHDDHHKPCLIIDLDETLVHSSFKPIPSADFIVPVEIDGTIYQVYVQKRPHVDEFLQRVGNMYECVLFTASLAKYADPVADLLDKWGVFRARLFREACVFYRGNYVKDLGQLGREIDRVAIIDNSPASYLLHPENAIPVTSWFDDPHDTQLLELLPVLEKLADHLAPSVRKLGLRDLLRELVGPVPHVSPLAPPTPIGSNSVVTSAVNPNNNNNNTTTTTNNSNNNQASSNSSTISTGDSSSSTRISSTQQALSSTTSTRNTSSPSSPFSPQPVQLVVVGPGVQTSSAVHNMSPPSNSSTVNRTQLRTTRYNVH